MKTLVLLRHGQSTWNQENRFTGWKDVDLTEQGRAEAREAGRLLQAEGLDFDRVHTSLLKRAIRTMWLVMEEMDRMWLPVVRSWELNERHYGALQGLNKAETAAKHGEDQVKVWRRSFDIPPPAMDRDDERHPRHDRRYAAVAPERLPGAESLKDTIARVRPWWEQQAVPALQRSERLLVVAHGNSLRALVKDLDRISDQDIVGLNIPTGVPLVYELEDDLRPRSHRYLGDPEAVARAAQAVADQGRKGA